MNADFVLLGGNVITIDLKKPRAEAVAIRDGRFLQVGSNKEAKEAIGRSTKVRDLCGATVVPGFNDAHCHPLLFAMSLEDINLGESSIRSVGNILNLVAKQAGRQEVGTWIKGKGYDQNQLEEGRHVTRWELDDVAPDHFVRLTHFGLHSSVVNSKVLALAGITKDTIDPEGGRIERDPKTGEPTGTILEMPAIALIDKVMPKTSYRDVIENLGIVNQTFLSQGITSYSDAGVGLQADLPRVIGAYQEAVETGVLNVRCNLEMWHESFLDYSRINEELETLDERLFRFGIRSGLGDERLRIGPFKIIMDGAISLGTAATYEPYGAEGQSTGLLTMEPRVLNKLVLALHQRGWQMSIHAIGDRATDVVLDAYEIVLGHTPQVKKKHRHRIEHCFLMSLSQMIRMEQLGVLCVTQPQLMLDAGDGHFKQLGEQRAQRAFCFRTMLDNNVFTVFSSDRPCSGGVPMLGIHAAVNRRTKSGRDYRLEQAISPEVVLRLYTVNGAYATFEETIKGTVEVGKLADLVLLDEDPTKVEPERIKDISVLATMVGGKIVYEK